MNQPSRPIADGVAPPSRRPAFRFEAGPPRRDRRAGVGRGGLERLEGRALLSVYQPAVADYGGGTQAELAVFRKNDNNAGLPEANSALLIQSASPVGYELGLAGFDTPVSADFEGIGQAQPAVYGFLNDVSYGDNYGDVTGAAGPQPFPQGSGRFAYIPTDGDYPATAAGAVNGTMATTLSKVVVVNLGSQGDLPAVGAYDAGGKAEFTVYEPSKGQFLYYPSATFNINADPTLPANAPVAVPLGGPGDVPASADYQGTGHDDFAVYDPAHGEFLVRPDGGGATVVVPIGGPGDVPVSADFEGVGHADFAVYNSSTGKFLVKPANGGAIETLAVGSPGDDPAVANYDGDRRADLATFTPGTLTFHIRRSSDGTIRDEAFTNPDAVPVQRTDDLATTEQKQILARGGDPQVVFLGDSITDFWARNFPQSWATIANKYGAVDDGIGGDSIQNVLLRVNQGDLSSDPKVVVLLIGTNDFGYHDRTPAEVADSMSALIADIHAKSPNSSILLMADFPRGDNSPTDSPSLLAYYANISQDIRAFDTQYLPGLAQPVTPAELTGPLTGDHSLNIVTALNSNPLDPADYFVNTSLFVDELHPDAAGYLDWSVTIAPTLRAMLGLPAMPDDYEGTAKSDPAVYLPTLGEVAIRPATGAPDEVVPFGIAGAGQTVPAPGDYDGDGKADIAAYLPSIGAFAIRPSSGGPDQIVPFGLAGAGQTIPAPGDYDGSGKTEIAAYLPSLGEFVYRPAKGGPDKVIPFGMAGAGNSIPVPGDYDGSGKAEIAVYLPSIGAFAIRPSSGGPDEIIPFGFAGAGQSIPVPGDYDGSGKTELAVYLPALGEFVYRPADGGPDGFVPFGTAGVGQSIPAPGDYDGDGKTDFAVYLPAAGELAYRPSSGGADVVEPLGIGGSGRTLPLTEPELPAAIPTPAATVTAASVGTKHKAHPAKKA